MLASQGIPVPQVAALLGRNLTVSSLVEHTGSVYNRISFVATGAKTSGVVSPAVFAYGETETVGVLNPVLGALDANSVVPGLATRVRGGCIIFRGPNTSSVDEGVSAVACQTETDIIEGSADVLDGGAESQCVEDPSKRAFKTNSTLPSAAARISGGSYVGRRVKAGSVDQIVAFVAGEAEPINGIPGPAFIINSLADAIGVEESPLGACLASVCPPFGAVWVGVHIS